MNTTMPPGHGDTSQMTMEWDPALIALSYLASVQAAYTAVLILQMRFSRLLLALAALCLSVSGIWSMHFIGMAAMTIGTRIEYDVGWTVASVIFAYVPTLVAFVLLDRAMRGRSRSTDDVSIAANIAAFLDAPHLAIVGAALLIALGVCCMHYCGMVAMKPVGGERVLEWGVIAASCIIAVAAATAALYFAFILPLTRRYTIPTAAVAGVAVCGMHYCGMYGFKFRMDGSGAAVAGGGASSSSIDGIIIYIVFGSSAVSSASLAFTSFLYRLQLRAAADDADEVADKVVAGRFDEISGAETDAATAADEDPVTRKFRLAYVKLGDQLRLLKSFMPASLLAQFEAQQNGEMDEEGNGALNDDDDEGDLSKSLGSASRSVARSPMAASISSSPTKPTFASRVRDDVSTSSGSSRNAHPHGTPHMTAGVSRRNVAILAINVIDFHLRFEQTPRWYGASFVSGLEAVSKRTRGVIELLSGDHAMVSFNASRACGSAMSACLTMATTLERALGDACLSMGAAGGAATVGNMGTETLRRFTIAGAPVKTAWALERHCRARHEATGVHALCTWSVDAATNFELRALDTVDVGRGARAVAYEPTPLPTRKESDEWIYELALQNSRFAWWERANRAVEALLDGDEVDLAELARALAPQQQQQQKQQSQQQTDKGAATKPATAVVTRAPSFATHESPLLVSSPPVHSSAGIVQVLPTMSLGPAAPSSTKDAKGGSFVSQCLFVQSEKAKRLAVLTLIDRLACRGGAFLKAAGDDSLSSIP